jgi:hypothetical protein
MLEVLIVGEQGHIKPSTSQNTYGSFLKLKKGDILRVEFGGFK